MALIFWEWKWIDVLSKQTNNGNLLFANAVNAVIRLLLLFPRDLRIQQSMKLTVINNSCNYVLASPPPSVPLSPRMQFSLNLHGMMHSRSQISTLIALDGLLSYVSGPNKKWAAGYLIEISSSDGTRGAGNVSPAVCGKQQKLYLWVTGFYCGDAGIHLWMLEYTFVYVAPHIHFSQIKDWFRFLSSSSNSDLWVQVFPWPSKCR